MALAATLLGSTLAAQAQDATVPVATLDRGLSELLVTPTSVPFAQRYAKMAPIVDQAFGYTAILQAIVGPRWGSLPAAQQQALLTSFRRYTVSNYVANFSAGAGTAIKLKPGSQTVGDGQLVSTLIAPATGDATAINYVVKRGAQGWRITDVYLDGTISQVAVQRSDFRSLLSSDNADALIKRLDSKVAELSGGAVKP